MSITNVLITQDLNIARGTTDPGYRVYNLNYLFNYIEFESILAAEITQILESIPGIPGILGSDKKPHTK